MRPASDHPDLSPEALAAANIVPGTMLATDYLNVFNEAVMLLGLVADMPDMIDELKAWEPLSYREHFQRSGFQARDLAILAYEHADPAVRGPFDALSEQVAGQIGQAIADAEADIAAGRELDVAIAAAIVDIQARLMVLDGMVHGTGHDDQPGASAQDDIDALFD